MGAVNEHLKTQEPVYPFRLSAPEPALSAVWRSAQTPVSTPFPSPITWTIVDVVALDPLSSPPITRHLLRSPFQSDESFPPRLTYNVSA